MFFYEQPLDSFMCWELIGENEKKKLVEDKIRVILNREGGIFLCMCERKSVKSEWVDRWIDEGKEYRREDSEKEHPHSLS